ncbi:MAG: hypothetical protein ACTHOO_08460 [Alcanivorax sp.]
MDMDSVNRDFTGTSINSPMDKMRAMSIINAKDDPSGLSLINFNITTFLGKSRLSDAYYILGLWATEPVRRSPGKFIRFPQAGKEALLNRSNSLLTRLSEREDIDAAFVHEASQAIQGMVEKEITYLCRNEHTSEIA